KIIPGATSSTTISALLTFRRSSVRSSGGDDLPGSTRKFVADIMHPLRSNNLSGRVRKVWHRTAHRTPPPTPHLSYKPSSILPEFEGRRLFNHRGSFFWGNFVRNQPLHRVQHGLSNRRRQELVVVKLEVRRLV